MHKVIPATFWHPLEPSLGIQGIQLQSLLQDTCLTGQTALHYNTRQDPYLNNEDELSCLTLVSLSKKLYKMTAKNLAKSISGCPIMHMLSSRPAKCCDLYGIHVRSGGGGRMLILI